MVGQRGEGVGCDIKYCCMYFVGGMEEVVGGGDGTYRTRLNNGTVSYVKSWAASREGRKEWTVGERTSVDPIKSLRIAVVMEVGLGV